jgi:hypothetical protein
MLGEFEVILGHLGTYVAAILRLSWGHLDPFWGHLGPIFEFFGAVYQTSEDCLANRRNCQTTELFP